MIIEKKQRDVSRCIFNWSYFNSAREGFKRILQTEEISGRKILVPAYIGYSTKEGSGVFDPIRETGTEYLFYNMDKRLNIDLKDLEKKVAENRNNILFIIHYFGFTDKNLVDIRKYAKRRNMIIIEDFAQAFFTFWSNPVVDFDYGIFSIHKLFPFDAGGMVIGREKISDSVDKSPVKYDLFQYNMKEIARKRIENYMYILSVLKKKAGLYRIKILREKLGGAVPHSFPILLPTTELRDKLYFQMNDEGYGVASLYHTLVDEIDRSFTAVHEISSRILNLPVHQDAEKKDLGCMLERMFEINGRY